MSNTHRSTDSDSYYSCVGVCVVGLLERLGPAEVVNPPSGLLSGRFVCVGAKRQREMKKIERYHTASDNTKRLSNARLTAHVVQQMY